MTGKKFDEGKPMMHLLPRDAAVAVVKGMMHGASKYGRANWEEGIAWCRLWDACRRHLDRWMDGHEIDEDSGLPHLYLAGCEIMMLIASTERDIGDDDRICTAQANKAHTAPAPSCTV